jgi:hypothetical protein
VWTLNKKRFKVTSKGERKEEGGKGERKKERGGKGKGKGGKGLFLSKKSNPAPKK